MPPRASVPRRRRADQSADDPQPLLPSLNGTPSSRRQFTYGGKPEPKPARRTHKGDLAAAVQASLEQTEVKRKEAERQLALSRAYEAYVDSNPNRFLVDDDEVDELSMDERTFQQTSAGGNPYLAIHRPPPHRYASLRDDVSEFDDARSFGVESDYYGDATIASTPVSVLLPRAPNELSALPPNGLTYASQQPSSPPKRPSHLRNRQGVSPEDMESEDPISDLKRGRRHRPEQSVAKTSPKRQSKRSRGSTTASTEDGEPRREEIEEENSVQADPLARPDDEALEPISQRNSTAQTRIEEQASSWLQQRRRAQSQSQSKTNRTSRSPSKQHDAEERLHELPREKGGFWERLTPQHLRQTAHGEAGGSRHHRPDRTTHQPAQSFFAQAKSFALSSSPFRQRRRPEPAYASVESQQDDELQQEISRESREAEKAAEKEAREEEAEARRQAWADWWARTRRQFSLGGQGRPVEIGDEYLLEEQRNRGRLKWLNPLTYVMLAVSWLNTITRTALDFTLFHGRRAWIWVSSNHKSLGLAAVALSLLVAFTFEEVRDYLPQVPEVSLPDTNILSNVEELGHRLRNLIPDFPSTSRRFRLEDLVDLDDEDQDRIGHIIKAIEKEINQAGTAIKSQGLALQRLEQVLPAVVHMELKNGKPVVSDHFWHALRDLIHQDEDIMTFDQIRGPYGVSSEKQWNAITAQLAHDPALDKRWKHELKEAGDHIQQDMAEKWETWTRNNDKRIQEQLGLVRGQTADDAASIKALIGDQLKDSEINGRLITRDEFLRHIRNEFTAHRSEISAQFKELSPQLAKLAQDSMKLALKDVPKGMSRKETEILVANLLRKGIADLNLQSMANGQIKAHWEEELKHRINYFNMAAGAVINKKLTSPDFDPLHRRSLSDKTFAAAKHDPNLRSKLGVFPPSKVQLGWEEDGDCWCALRSKSRRGNPHGVMVALILGYKVIPTHLVVEHILPGATVDPDSRPKNIEVYISIEDSTLRSHLDDFSEVHFPDDRDDWNYTPADELDKSFVKVGEFVMEDIERMDGKYLYRFSQELEIMRAATDNVVVRAVSNYGAERRTCFYRLRLYGEKVEEEIEGHQGRMKSP